MPNDILAAIDKALGEVPAPLDPSLLRELAVELSFELTPTEKKNLVALQQASDKFAEQIAAHVKRSGAVKYRDELDAAKAAAVAGKAVSVRTRKVVEAEHEIALDAIKAAGSSHAESVIVKCRPVIERFADSIERLCTTLTEKARARRTSIDGPDVDLIKWQAKHLRRRANEALAHWSQSPRRMLGDFLEI